jgi:hypothetical protein
VDAGVESLEALEAVEAVEAVEFTKLCGPHCPFASPLSSRRHRHPILEPHSHRRLVRLPKGRYRDLQLDRVRIPDGRLCQHPRRRADVLQDHDHRSHHIGYVHRCELQPRHVPRGKSAHLCECTWGKSSSRARHSHIVVFPSTLIPPILKPDERIMRYCYAAFGLSGLSLLGVPPATSHSSIVIPYNSAPAPVPVPKPR